MTDEKLAAAFDAGDAQTRAERWRVLSRAFNQRREAMVAAMNTHPRLMSAGLPPALIDDMAWAVLLSVGPDEFMAETLKAMARPERPDSLASDIAFATCTSLLLAAIAANAPSMRRR